MGIKFRLIVMNFLQYAIWGSWLISLGAYLGGGLDFTGLQIGSFFATMGIASLFIKQKVLLKLQKKKNKLIIQNIIIVLL